MITEEKFKDSMSKTVNLKDYEILDGKVWELNIVV